MWVAGWDDSVPADPVAHSPWFPKALRRAVGTIGDFALFLTPGIVILESSSSSLTTRAEYRLEATLGAVACPCRYGDHVADHDEIEPHGCTVK